MMKKKKIFQNLIEKLPKSDWSLTNKLSKSDVKMIDKELDLTEKLSDFNQKSQK